MGDTSIAHELGKKGTSSDITIYDRKSADTDRIFSYCFPNTYPEKLQPLLQSIAMADYAILNISKLDTFLGEQILALDIFGVKEGFILYSYDVDVEKVKNIVKNTRLSSFQILESVDQLKSIITRIMPEKEADKENKGSNDNAVYISIDHVFDVKGVGNVVLGTIKQGEVKIYDELEIHPSNKSIVIKSIQMHDDPVTTSKKPARVGLAIKGISAKEVSRGDIITSKGIAKTVSSFQIKFNKNKYYKDDIIETQNYMINVGLQIRSAKIKKINDSELVVSIEKPIAYVNNDLCILFNPDSKTMRIVGCGIME